MSVETTIAISKETAERLRAAVTSANGSIEALNAAVGLMQSNTDKQGPLVAGAETGALRKMELVSILREIETIAAGLEAYTADIVTIQDRIATDAQPLTASSGRISATVSSIAANLAAQTHQPKVATGVAGSAVSEAISAALSAANR
jgi:hypothetical protein